MSSCRERRAAPRRTATLLAAIALGAGAAEPPRPSAYPGIGRAATTKELAAWDIDVRPDLAGLPKGSGSVAQGQAIWEAHCASCHGVFGESNEVFFPLVGGTTAQDVSSGRVARLTDPSYPGRTTFMKLSTVSTLWDYINRAMPWNAPKSLGTDEVYAVTAYLLNLAGVVPDGYVLSDATMRDVQQRLPNRNGMTTDHALWPGRGIGHADKPDVRAVACMKDCGPEPKVASFLPEHARNNNGNLAEQQRSVGPQRGVQTAPPEANANGAATVAAAPAAIGSNAAAIALTQHYTCTACHAIDAKMVGPAFKEVAARYAGRGDAQTYLVDKIRSGGQGVWGTTPMPPQAVPEGDLKAIAGWLAGGARP